MRVTDLHHEELLDLDLEGGSIRFAGQRALLIDAVALGVLRQYLVENFGATAARTVLTQFGFAHGWRLAGAMKTEFPWADNDKWRLAGLRIFTMEGLFRMQSGSEDMLREEGAMLLESYEAEQHMLHYGRAEYPVCWTICGLISGYASHTVGTEVYVVEQRCVGQGHAACHLVGRTRAAWGAERADDLAFFNGNRLKDSLDVSLSRVLETLKAIEAKLQAHRRVLRRVARSDLDSHGLCVQSATMRACVELACRVAKVDATVLITGESGVGKERIARLIHDESHRAAGPFVAVNCSAISESLLESELFGHTRGAFTGATSDRPGLFEAANRGTLLLDEVGDVSPNMQAKLLRTLQEREVRRVGENRSRPVDVRVLAATNRALTDAIVEGTFRQDLYYRLKVVELRVPSLRERRDDILPLARTLLSSAVARMGGDIQGMTTAAADQVLRHDWPGNVRELENAMERAVALARGDRVDVDDLPEEARLALPTMVLRPGAVLPLKTLEKDYILAVLSLNDGNQTQTAQQLGIGTATLYRKLKRYSVPGATPGEPDKT